MIHTTETVGVPGYDDGKSAPHLTYNTSNRRFYQHTEFTSPARSLRDETGGIATNRDQAIQLEIVCYSAKAIADQVEERLWVGDLSVHHLSDISEFAVWVMRNFGVKATWPGKAALSYAEANASGFRMTNAGWDSYDGICGHQHVPENTHWDPGAFDWPRFMALLGGPMADHTHVPMPADLPRSWADGTWEEWVERSGTNDDTRTNTFYREDLGWVYARVIKPLEDKVASLQAQIDTLRAGGAGEGVSEARVRGLINASHKIVKL